MRRPPPPVLAMLAALAQQSLTRHAQAPTPTRAAVAASIGTTSGWLATTAAVQFRSRGTTVDPFDPSLATVLVTTGAYAVTRNPMYVSMAGLLVANAVRRASWTALLPAAAFVLVIDRWQVEAEEAALRARFGADYAAYHESVPRWLGPRSPAAATRTSG